MWNQQNSGWGWPPNQYNQYNQYQQPQGDAAQNWAAAAALWAQQRQIQEQYQQNPVGVRPPEPPGPPPDAPPTNVEDGSGVAVHDYNHGHLPEQQPQVFDYKHQNPASQLPADTENHEANVIDYNHGKNDEEPPHTTNDFQYNNNWNYNNQAAPNWNENAYYQQQVQQNWNQNWNQEHNFEHEKQEQHDNNFHHNNFNNERNAHKPSGFHPINNHNNKTFSDHSGNNTPDPVDVNKKKALPLWLRDGLEKLEKDKKKHEKKVIPSAKNISGYQHGSPTSSPDRQEESDAELSDKADDSPVIHNRKRSPSPEEDLSDEEKQRRLMLKIKTWLTETLLRVTNSELKNICDETLFEMRRSAKNKATNVYRSGGLEALRTAGGDDVTSSEEEEPQPSPTSRKSRYTETTKKVSKPDIEGKTKCVDQHEKQENGKSSGLHHTKEEEIKSSKLKDSEKSDKHNSEKSSRKNETEKRSSTTTRKRKDSDKQDSHHKSPQSSSKKKKKRKASVTSDSEATYSSDESERESRRDRKKIRKKSRHRSRSASRSPLVTKSSRKKSSKYDKDDEDSVDDSDSYYEERKSKKKKKKHHRRTSSDEEESDVDSDYSSSRRKKKSKGKKHKQKERSASRSPKRSKRKK